jgi:DNA-binding NarL/FixJ family response regulator
MDRLRSMIAPSGGGRLDTLSSQELRVLAEVAAGKTNKEIARDLTLSDKTVRNHLSNVYEKLSVHRRSQAIAQYIHRKSH